MLTVAISKRNKLQNIIVLTPKDGFLDKNKTDRENCRTDSLGCFIYENKFGNYQ